jgi:hypothetical protein
LGNGRAKSSIQLPEVVRQLESNGLNIAHKTAEFVRRAEVLKRVKNFGYIPNRNAPKRVS